MHDNILGTIFKKTNYYHAKKNFPPIPYGSLKNQHPHLYFWETYDSYIILLLLRIWMNYWRKVKETLISSFLSTPGILLNTGTVFSLKLFRPSYQRDHRRYFKWSSVYWLACPIYNGTLLKLSLFKD